MPDYKILLIDYDPRSIEQLRGPLVAAGMTVEVAKDGIAGIKRFHELEPDLTLIEAMIPKKHGFEVCLELKRTPHGEASAVLIISSVYKGRKYRTQAMHSYRCDEYLEKPITDEQLVAIVRRHLPEREDEPGPTATTSGSRTPDGQERHASGLSPGVNPLHDVSDGEVVDRLDELLRDDLASSPEGGGTPADGGSSKDHREPASKERAPGTVVSFDAERVRMRAGLIGEDRGATPYRTGSWFSLPSGGAQPAIRHETAELPEVLPRIEPRPSRQTGSEPPTAPPVTRGSRERLYFWVALALAAALATLIAAIAL